MVDTAFPDSVELEYYPNTTIFVNLLNISFSKKLRDKEAGFTAIRSIELLQNKFTRKGHWLGLHKNHIAFRSAEPDIMCKAEE